jgi:hypothetical protein
MKLNEYTKYVIVGAVILILDFIWIGSNLSLYSNAVKAVQKSSMVVNYYYAFLAYVLVLFSSLYIAIPFTKLHLQKNDDIVQGHTQMITEEETGPPVDNLQAPPMVFAINDQGNLDLADMSGKILNIGYGPNPKTYIGLLDKAEKDTEKVESESGVSFTSKVGNTKLYEVVGRPYIINYTRL